MNVMMENQITYPRNSVTSYKPSKYLRKVFFYRRNYFLLKRTFDVVLSLFVVFFFLLWLFPIIAILIKIGSKGPVFFVQKRVGFLGKTFNCFKFRTMIYDKASEQCAAKPEDKRITKVGAFLRRSNLDELPQFINVLMGDMSIVGPRPHMYSDCARFSNIIEDYKFRSFMKPGITGLAQVKGFRGPAETFDQIFHRYQYDAFYVRNANFWLDIRIVRQTAAQTVFYILGKLMGKEDFHERARKMKIYRKLTFSLKQLLSRA